MDTLHTKEMVTCAEMKALEQAADRAGLSYYQMMENAGSRAAEIILQHAPETEKAVIFCGKGNNGGDGFVAARKLRQAGLQVQVVLVEGEPVTADAKTNYELLSGDVEIFDGKDYRLKDADLLVDAIYGTGFHGSLRSPADRIIECFNEARAFKAALDLPSGLSGDMQDAEPAGPCIHADLTITFHAKKPVHLCSGAAPFMGQIVCADIGICEALENGEKKL